MSSTVTYKGTTLTTVNNQTRVLQTSGQYLEDNITIVDSSPVVKERKDVNFYDYDGTIVESYTATEFGQLTEMPANPTHTGLTSQGWNWTLSDAKAQVLISGGLDIGQMYVTDDGKTRLYIHLEKGRLKPYLAIGLNGTAIIDWGDGSSTVTWTGTSLTSNQYGSHTYASPGDYMISINVTSGTARIWGSSTNSVSYLLRKSTNTQASVNRVYANSLIRVELGLRMQIGQYAFSYCGSLASITLPQTLTSIEQYGFYCCLTLKYITLPKDLDTSAKYLFGYNQGLQAISFPKTLTNIPTAGLGYCYVLQSLTIPEGVTILYDSSIYQCYGLSKIVLPSTLTKIYGSALSNCYGLGYIRFNSITPPELVNSNAFGNLQSDCIISVPAGSLSDYTGATNYPSSSTYTYIEE